MKTDYIIIKEYLQLGNVDQQFISLLEENDLIHIYEIENERFLHYDELADIERYARMYYDLSINIEGIDAIHHLLERINQLQNEMKDLRNQLRFLE
ncbi:MAG: chaperone modulator CbpM [Bacteroidales bacterium]|nr:chaperone modulator CbpM [Bacteroidales bacterium]